MEKLIKFNLLFTAVIVLIVSAASEILPHPDSCKKFIVVVDVGEGGSGGVTYIVNECPLNLCFIPEYQCCDFPAKCKRCNPPAEY